MLELNLPSNVHGGVQSHSWDSLLGCALGRSWRRLVTLISLGVILIAAGLVAFIATALHCTHTKTRRAQRPVLNTEPPRGLPPSRSPPLRWRDISADTGTERVRELSTRGHARPR